MDGQAAAGAYELFDGRRCVRRLQKRSDGLSNQHCIFQHSNAAHIGNSD
jgi:hypothetical protein